MSSYADFLRDKKSRVPRQGRSVPESDVHHTLHPFQREIVAWACGVGRAAIRAGESR